MNLKLEGRDQQRLLFALQTIIHKRRNEKEDVSNYKKLFAKIDSLERLE